MKLLRTGLIAASALWALSAHAQWQVPNNSIPVGRGPGVVGFGSVSGTNGQCLTISGGVPTFATCAGDVSGPGSSTDNAVARFDGTTGKLLQNSTALLSDTGVLTNTTFDTAGTGNSFSINGLAVTANTGTGAVARATSPTFTTPTLGVASATTINKVTLTAPATGSTLTIANGKTLTASNSLTLAGTDATVMTFPSVSQSIPGIDAANIFTNSQNVHFPQNTISRFGVLNIDTGTNAVAEFRAASASGSIYMAAYNNPNGTGVGGVEWTGSSAFVLTANNASGSIAFQTGGFNNRMYISTVGGVSIGDTNDAGANNLRVLGVVRTVPLTVGTLPTCNAGAQGSHQFVTDSNAASYTAGIGSVVAAGGSTAVPVTCDGTNWRIG